MTVIRRLILICAAVYVSFSAASQVSDAIIAGRIAAAVFMTIGGIGMACAIFNEVMKDRTK